MKKYQLKICQPRSCNSTRLLPTNPCGAPAQSPDNPLRAAGAGRQSDPSRNLKTQGKFMINGIGDNRQIRAEGMQKWWWTFRYLDLHAHLQINEKNLCLPENQAQKNKSAHWWTARGYDAVHKKNRGSCGRETERGWKQFAKGQNKIAITNTEIVMQIKFLIFFIVMEFQIANKVLAWLYGTKDCASNRISST